MVIMGGPLMGFTLPWLDVPVVKITNCLLAPSASEMGEPEEEKGCIRSVRAEREKGRHPLQRLCGRLPGRSSAAAALLVQQRPAARQSHQP